MYLKAVEIQGFKSFPDKTRLTFTNGVTAIVGPNGSGKSNISDAVLWVMGEQRTKALRSSKMEDVVFGGTEKRGKLGFAQVSLIIDNSEKIIDSDLPEITLTRRYFRSGDSEYYINKESCRLKDINDLLMDTGLGRDGYSIIGQGKIGEIISNRSTDRREVFEEAAGISRFRHRKEEAERKLEKTDENLVRIKDKLDELELQVGPLKKQSETAKKYLVLRDELRVREVSSWMATLDKLHADSEKIELELKQSNSELDKARARLEALYASSESITERMHKKDEESESIREKLSEVESERAGVEAELAVLNNKLQNSRESRTSLIRDIEERETRVAELKQQIAGADERLSGIGTERTALNSKTAENNNIISGCRMKISGREEIINDYTEKVNRCEVDTRSLKSRISMLEEMEKDFEGYSKAVKTVMRESARGTLRGICGPVANLVRTDSEYSLAIETALGGASQNIVVDTQNAAKAAIELLKRQDAGRATFRPIDVIRGRKMRENVENESGFVGIAIDLVRYESRYENVLTDLLGRTVIVETLTDAIRISNKFDNKLKLVTLDGQEMNAGGSMTGGSSSRTAGFISRANELEKCRSQLTTLLEKGKKAAQELERAKTGIAALKDSLDGALEIQSSLRAELSSLDAEEQALKRSRSQLNALYESLSGDKDARQQAVDDADADINSTNDLIKEKEVELESIGQRVRELKEKLGSVSGERLELESRRISNDKEVQTCGQDIIELERQCSKIEQKKAAAEYEENQIINKLWDNYELGHDAAQAIREPVESIPQLNKLIAELRKKISALGSPNIGAIEEFERVNTRYEFLKGQHDDVEKARKELLDILREITDNMKTVFVEKFNEINETFRTTFLELFGGGKAALILEDPDNVLECGIEIKVQPPGKALSTLTLLSGGEMAFVAIALYFAILKVRPTPFCIMDEIEAALDERNVTKYAEYMKRMSDKTQFLVITHRRGTMEEADALYGVTMQEKGVSTVIPLDLETAKMNAEG